MSGHREAILDETSRTVVAERVKRADTYLGRLVGLMGRRGLDEGEALWIAPCHGIHTMWMRFAIDAVFLDRELRVVAVREEVSPWRATGFIKEATSVLELEAGGARRAGVAVGNQMSFIPVKDERLEDVRCQ